MVAREQKIQHFREMFSKEIGHHRKITIFIRDTAQKPFHTEELLVSKLSQFIKKIGLCCRLIEYILLLIFYFLGFLFTWDHFYDYDI